MTVKLPYRIVSLLITIIYLVGIIGIMSTEWKATFLQLTPLNLLITFIIALSFQERSRNFWIWLIAICVLGFSIEVVGVNTGVIFGEYTYSESLGVKLFNTPLMIGINWGMLCMITCNLWASFKVSIGLKALLASLSMVALDLLIEPVCSFLNMWYWHKGSPPIQNYIAWGAIAFVFSMLFFKMHQGSSNKIAPILFTLQLLFFLSINLLR